jgi:L-amino acid N-acyltransferase YncA
LKACFEIQKPDKEWTLKSLRDSLANIFIVAEEKGEIIGYMMGYVDPCMKEDVVVHEVRVKLESRGKGIGKKLVNAFCKLCFKKGIKDISAGIQPAHLKFYRGCGFKKRMTWISVSRKRLG